MTYLSKVSFPRFFFFSLYFFGFYYLVRASLGESRLFANMAALRDVITATAVVNER